MLEGVRELTMTMLPRENGTQFGIAGMPIAIGGLGLESYYFDPLVYNPGGPLGGYRGGPGAQGSFVIATIPGPGVGACLGVSALVLGRKRCRKVTGHKAQAPRACLATQQGDC